MTLEHAKAELERLRKSFTRLEPLASMKPEHQDIAVHAAQMAKKQGVLWCLQAWRDRSLK